MADIGEKAISILAENLNLGVVILLQLYYVPGFSALPTALILACHAAAAQRHTPCKF